MLTWIALSCLIGAVAVLIALSLIDLKVRLLPNKLVACFAALGLAFHLATQGAFLSETEIILGGFAGFMALYLIRAVACRFYGEDALGLGDVKLMGAAGLWLGFDGVMLALSLGAFAALIHGFFYGLALALRTKTRPDFARLQIPAGPGFAVGIVAVGILQFTPWGQGILP